MHGRKSNTRVTLKMVAEKAGVTPGCVSLCLNGHPLAERISPETKSRIMEAVRILEYTPSPLGRALKSGSSRMIGLVIPLLSNNYFSFLAEHILAEAGKNGYQVLVTSSPEIPQNWLDGIISCVPLPEKGSRSCPCVYFELSGKGIRHTVRHDIEKGMRKTAEIMRNRGHRKVWGVFDTAETKAETFVKVFSQYSLETELLPCRTATREERRQCIRFLMEKKYPAVVINGHLTTSLFFRYLDREQGTDRENGGYHPDVGSICGYWNGESIHKNLLCATITDIPLAAKSAVGLLLEEIRSRSTEKKEWKVEASFYPASSFSSIAFTDPEMDF
ncbi:MAG: LacI family DNA-binding transcriptional regulator [Lentisphaeria bacterium]|nr:LacI family DNA-binding transcriptional regulator [Lentisphaeria bacterium]